MVVLHKLFHWRFHLLVLSIWSQFGIVFLRLSNRCITLRIVGTPSDPEGFLFLDLRKSPNRQRMCKNSCNMICFQLWKQWRWNTPLKLWRINERLFVSGALPFSTVSIRVTESAFIRSLLFDEFIHRSSIRNTSRCFRVCTRIDTHYLLFLLKYIWETLDEGCGEFLSLISRKERLEEFLCAHFEERNTDNVISNSNITTLISKIHLEGVYFSFFFVEAFPHFDEKCQQVHVCILISFIWLREGYLDTDWAISAHPFQEELFVQIYIHAISFLKLFLRKCRHINS